jgi:hypothetical protein
MGSGECNIGEVRQRSRERRMNEQIKEGWEIRDGLGLETQRLSITTAWGDSIFSAVTLRQAMS